MAKVPAPLTLQQALDFHASELWRYDLKWGLLGAVALGTIVGFYPDALEAVVPLAAAFAGVVVGVTIALVALQAAFLDVAFIRRLELVGKEPVRYLAPGMFSAILGVLAALAILAAAVVGAVDPPLPVLIVTAGIVGLLTVWALVSVIAALEMVVSFIALKRSAARISEDRVVELEREHGKDQGRQESG